MAAGAGSPPLSGEERRWLHDKYQGLAEYEARLADYRTSYFAAIVAALVAAQVLLVINLLYAPGVFATVSTLLALFGLLICGVWGLVLHRTISAMDLWREAEALLESVAPPIARPLEARLPARAGVPELSVDLSRPFQTYARRFSPQAGLAWADSIQPARLWADVPVLIAGAWAVAIAVVWTWYFVSV